ncbi:putative DPS protein [Salmonella phage pSal-SNUABM-01]|nr:putative DPS protein [Salmonella phage pSal-SNUABM-01]
MLTARPKRNVQTDSLQSLVGNLMLLQIKAKNYHWNVTGSSFTGLHRSFDKVADEAEDWVDTIAERMRALQLPVEATAELYYESRWFSEGSNELDSTEMVSDLVATLDTISTHIISMIRDEENPVTSSILETLGEEVDHQAYFIRSVL